MTSIEGWLHEIARSQNAMSQTIGRIEGQVMEVKARVEGVSKTAHAANSLAQRAVAYLEGKPISEIAKEPSDPINGFASYKVLMLVFGLIISAFVAGASVAAYIIGHGVAK